MTDLSPSLLSSQSNLERAELLSIQEKLKLYLSQRDYQQVKTVALSALAQGYKTADVYRALGQVMLKAKNWPQVVEQFSQAVVSSKRPRLSDYLAMMQGLHQLLLIEKPVIEHARQAIASALEFFEEKYQISLYQARFLMADREYAAAEQIWHAVYAHHGSVMTNVEIAEYARLLKNHNQYDLAREVLDKRLASTPDSIPLIRELARVNLTAKTKVKILADKVEYRITYFEQSQKSNTLFITFGTAPSGLEGHPFGFDFLIKQGFDLVYVAQQKGSQYQNLSIDDFKHYIQPIIRHDSVFTYGSSLGGYCALYFAGCIDATAIAAGPRNPCDPCLKIFKGPEIGPYRDMPHHHPKIAEHPRSQHQPFIIYDPAIEIDQTFFIHQVQPAYPNAHVWPVPHGGHPTLQILAEQGILKSFVLSIVEKQQFPPNTLFFENSAIWNLEYATYLLKQENPDQALAIQHLKRSIELNPSADAYIALITTLKQVKGCTAEIDEYSDTAKQRFPKHKKIMFV